MTNINFSKQKNFPVNRDGETVTFQADEGDLVGLTQNADGETEMVAADAASDVAQPAMGVHLESVRDPSEVNVSGFEGAQVEQNQLRRQVREEGDYTLVGDEGTYVTDGVYLTDVDGDLDLTPQEPVYLGLGGGVTQTEPSASGEIVQYIGVAVNATTFRLDVDHEYETVA